MHHTYNKTHLEDFKNAISKDTGLIMVAHTSNYRVVGFTESVEIKELIKLGKSKKIPVYMSYGKDKISKVDFEKSKTNVE